MPRKDSEEHVDSIAEQMENTTQDLLTRLDDSSWKTLFPDDHIGVRRAHHALYTEYRRLTNPIVFAIIFIFVALLAVDYLAYLDPQVYGLSISLWGAVLVIRPALKGRFVIAALAEGREKAIRETEAQTMVMSNTGFALLLGGFFLQIVALQVFPDREVMSQNVAAEIIPNLATILLILLAFYIAFEISTRFFSWLRS